MSHLTSISTKGKLTNKDILVEALENLGFKGVEAFDTPQKLKDYYEVRGQESQSESTAEVVIPFDRNRISSDAGFTLKNGEYELVADEMDLYRLRRQLDGLQTHYAEISIAEQLELIAKTAKSKNKGEPIIEREVLADGTVRIKLATPGDIRVANQNRQVIH